MGEKNSSEKVDTMLLLGADVIQTKKSSSEIARKIKDANPHTVVMLDQVSYSQNFFNARLTIGLGFPHRRRKVTAG